MENLEYSSSLACRKDQKEKQQTKINGDKLLARVRQYATGELKEQIESGLSNLISILETRIDEEQKADEAKISEIVTNYQNHIADADKKVLELHTDADKEKRKYYESLVDNMNNATSVFTYEKVRAKFSSLGTYEDSFELAKKCQSEIDRIKEEERQEKERLARKEKRITMISVSAIVAVIAVVVIISKVVIPNNNYNKAITLKNNGQYNKAIVVFTELNEYKDSANQITACENAIKDE